MELQQLIRPTILALQPYSSARDEFDGEADVFLDANESPYPTAYNRYPDPLQRKLKAKIATLKNVHPNQIFLGNGSDEAIDLLIRIFCTPGTDAIVMPVPTYGMYSVCAAVNQVAVKSVSLTSDFQLDVPTLLDAARGCKIMFLCSPNNPSGNLLRPEDVVTVLTSFEGIVVVDEAYIDFAASPGFIGSLHQFPTLVVLQTLSKAWGLAGLRLGMAFANAILISWMNKVKYPYNINTVTQELALARLNNIDAFRQQVTQLNNERDNLVKSLQLLPAVITVYPSDANFLLVKFRNAASVFQTLLNRKIIVRDRSRVILCDDCLRITVGTPEENQQLLNVLSTL